MDNRAYWILHLFLLLAVVLSRFDAAVISIALIVAIFSNLGTSDSEYSAYSIFNKGCEYLLGDARADQIDKQLRGGGVRRDTPNEPADPNPNFIDIPSKFMNRPCPCGSGWKAKKCHASRKTVSSASNNSNKEKQYDYSGFDVLNR